MSTYDLIKVERKNNLPFKADKIFGNVISLCKTSNGKYLLREENEMFGTLKIEIPMGLKSALLDITLTKVDENSTEFHVIGYNTRFSNAEHAVISTAIDKFVKLLGMKLKGEVVTKKTVKDIAGGIGDGAGCIWVIIAVAILFFAFYIVFVANQQGF